MEPLCRLADFGTLLGIPATVLTDIEPKLRALTENVYTLRLPVLFGGDDAADDRIKALIERLDEAAPTETDRAILAELRPFVVHSVWAVHVLQGNVSYTQTGPVSKNRSESADITDVQRAQLRSYHQSQADMYALRVQKQASRLLTDSCQPKGAVLGRTFTTVRGHARSRFD